ncbi:Conserved oligomeric Golgi complex subunit 2 [Halotydeus destructor]|nr:Conserved oligomeric Golgi complex subunit 2 [Halotydeus destructor]
MLSMEENPEKKATMEIIPEPPVDARFSKQDFVDDDFVVDLFVRKHRSHTSLEELREVLSVYLKHIRLALNDLINRDYADFVNLSSNLVGMDKSISLLTSSLEISHKEVVKTRDLYCEVVSAVKDKLNSLKETSLFRERTESIIEAARSLTDLEKLLKALKDSEHSRKQRQIDFQHLFIGIQYVRSLLNNSQISMPLLINLQLRTSVAYATISKICEAKFVEAIEMNDVDTASEVYELYEQYDERSRLEALIRTTIVKPELEAIQYSVINKEPDDMMQYVNDFVDSRFACLKSVKNYDNVASILTVYAEIVYHLEFLKYPYVEDIKNKLLNNY